jgi:hypothetical protein
MNLEMRPNRNFLERFTHVAVPSRSEDRDRGELRPQESRRKVEGKRVSGGNEGAHVCWAALQKS